MNFMRTFDKPFFDVKNFIVKKEQFLHRENKSKSPYHGGIYDIGFGK